MVADFRFALRVLGRAPGFFCLAVATIGLGIAANAAVFSLFHQVLLRSLQVPEPERLVVFHCEDLRLPGGRSSDNRETVFSYPLYLRLRDHSRAFRGIAARAGAAVQIGLEGVAERGNAEVVSGNFFDVLGIRPHIGRLLGPGDDSIPGGNPVTVLSFDFWTRRFGASASVLGRKVLINGNAFTVIGVAPEGFRGVVAGARRELFVPISMMGSMVPGWNHFDDPGVQWLTMLGRLGPGVSRETASAGPQPVFASVLREHVERLAVHNARVRELLASRRIELRPAARGLNELERQWRRPLFVLLGMVFLLLLIGCANLANLLMARAVMRAREIATRCALGAGRFRIARLLLAESLLLAVVGTLCGVVLAPVLARSILRMLPEHALGGWIPPDISLPVLGFCALLMVVVTLLFGLAPALEAARGDLSSLGGRSQSGSGGRFHARMRKALVALQVALSLVLLAAAGLFGRSVNNLMCYQPGFRAEGLLTFSIDPGLSGYSVKRGLNFYRELTRCLEALPGVESVSVNAYGPLSDSEASTNVSVEGYTAGDEQETVCDVDAVGQGYFRTLRTPLRQGREFEERDRDRKVVIVNEAFLRRFFAQRSPLGRRMSVGAGVPLDMEIIGVAADVNALGLREPAKPTYYVPFEQPLPFGASEPDRVQRGTFFVRSRGAIEPLADAVRRTVAGLDSTLPVFAIRPMAVVVRESVYTDRLIAALSTAFAVVAAMLTALGLYGVIAYLTSRRQGEIGIRMALGAARGRVVWLVMREILVVAFAGGALGLAGAFWAGRIMESQLFGVRGFDPLVFSLSPVVLLAVALCAGALPAVRASRIKPWQALRHD